ncbi:hypothetical protein A2U01_0075449, partial [Trifolium medium]|nr:hypothetical protein [Trifolium medium]
VSHKRSRLDTVIDLEVPDKKCMLPPCFSSGQIFVNDQTLSVSPAETAIIRDLGAVSRKKVLAEDVAALVRLDEMALVLNEEGTSSEREIAKLRAR